jgi:branched-chain amino acid transport system substrate-binding protein
MVKKRLTTLSTLAIYFSSLFALIFLSYSDCYAADEIKIGAAVSLSGKLAREGQGLKQGYDFWADYVNQKNGVTVGGKNYKVNMIYYDDESNPQRSAKLTEKLISEDKVNFIFGPYSSGIAIATSAISERYRVVTILPLANSDKIYEMGYKYVFGLLPLASVDMVPMVDLCLKQSPKPKSLAIIATNSIYPITLSNGLKEYAEKMGVEIVYFQKFPEDTSDASSMLAVIKDKNPDMLFEVGYYEHSVLINRQLIDLRWIPKALAYSLGPQLPEFAKTLGKDAEGAMAVAYWNRALQYKDKTFGSTQEYAELVNKKLNEYPIHLQAWGTAAGLILQEVLKISNSLEQDKIRQALLTIEIPDSIVGPIKFDEKGKNIWATNAVIQVQNGTQKIVYPEKAANAKFIYPVVPWDKR